MFLFSVCNDETRFHLNGVFFESDGSNCRMVSTDGHRLSKAPTGAIEVTSYGVTKLRRDNMQIPALHVRAVVTNDGDDQPWTLDTTQQLVEIPGEGNSRAIFVNADIGTLPNMTIARH